MEGPGATGGTRVMAKEGFSRPGGDIFKWGSGSGVAAATFSLEGGSFADGREDDFPQEPNPTTAR
jgi:hypothetical protein